MFDVMFVSQFSHVRSCFTFICCVHSVRSRRWWNYVVLYLVWTLLADLFWELFLIFFLFLFLRLHPPRHADSAFYWRGDRQCVYWFGGQCFQKGTCRCRLAQYGSILSPCLRHGWAHIFLINLFTFYATTHCNTQVTL